MWRVWLLLVVFVGGFVALGWYSATGETGPMGWLNAWQAQDSGTYSRSLSFTIMIFVGCFLAIPVVVLWLMLLIKWRAKFPQANKVPAIAAPVPVPAATPAKPSPGWVTALKVWSVGIVLVWGAVLAIQGWGFFHKVDDAGSDYGPMRLSRASPESHPDKGRHLALAGRILWDHGLKRTGTHQTEALFVPVTGDDWVPGDPVHFVAQMNRDQAARLQQLATLPKFRTPTGPLLVRVDGEIPTVTRPFFARDGAPVADSAVLVAVVDSQAGQVKDAKPQFDWKLTGILGGVFSALWTLMVGAVPLGMRVDAWKLRRRAARGVT